MGLYDRDYMRRDDRPEPPPGGRAGQIAFYLLLGALALYALRAHPALVRRYVTRPFHQIFHNHHRPAS